MSPGTAGGLQQLVGRALNERYVLRELLGSGGFGGVFLTEQHVLGRPVRKVACKVSRTTGITEDVAGSLFADILQLAGAMEGSLELEQSGPGGSTFRLCLPASEHAQGS